MAGNDGHWTAWKGDSTTRRTFIRTVGVGAATTGVATGTAQGAVDAETTVDLGSRGLSKGDLIDPYLDEHFEDGTVVRVPAGEYDYDGSGLEGSYANAALVGDGDGVRLTRLPDVDAGPTITATAGVVYIGNITVRGTPGGDQSRWRVGAEAGATVAMYDLDFSDPSSARDSLPNRLEIDGTADEAASAPYELSVTGALTLDEGRTVVGRGEALYLGGDIGQGIVSGEVRNGVDAFFYGGRLDRVEIDGGAAVELVQG